MATIRRTAGILAASFAVLIAVPTSANAWEGGGDVGGDGPDSGGGDPTLSANVSQIRVTQESGSSGDGGEGNLAPIDTNWEPPVCWYEPLFTPKQLKKVVEDKEISEVGIHEFWSNGIFVDHYDKGEKQDNFDDENSIAEGYKNYNIGKGGYFWRSVAPDESHPDSWDCGRIMFWMPENEVPDIPNAPTPETLAGYAYEKVKVPDTEVELKPANKSTVNLPTWVWLDKGTFKDVVVRAELPKTDLWAETTAKPVSLNLDPGTEDAKTYPASGECKINEDGSIGTPYKKGDAEKTPPCGIEYLRASKAPYELKASITWEISWEGTGGAGDTLPSGTFETTQDMTVQEIQSINR